MTLYIKREDLVDNELGGNKWRKLKYNLDEAYRQQHDTLLTFGGAWSNHIYATAATGHRLGYKTIGVIRGEPHVPLNPTLAFATEHGMQLHYIDRTSYRDKVSPEFIARLQQQFGRFYLLPEGGSNALALRGCAEIVEEIDAPFDVICAACGSGGTLAGIASAISAQQQALGFAVLKDGAFLADAAHDLLQQASLQTAGTWHVNTDYHFGGYAKTNHTLFNFMRAFRREFGIMLDAVYTAKMFYGLLDLVSKGYFEKGTRIVAIHSGGLQGNRGFSELQQT